MYIYTRYGQYRGEPYDATNISRYFQQIWKTRWILRQFFPFEHRPAAIAIIIQGLPQLIIQGWNLIQGGRMTCCSLCQPMFYVVRSTNVYIHIHIYIIRRVSRQFLDIWSVSVMGISWAYNQWCMVHSHPFHNGNPHDGYIYIDHYKSLLMDWWSSRIWHLFYTI